MARTVSAATTYSRFSLLEIQVRALLRETAGADKATLDKVSKGIAPPDHYIESVAVRGLYPHGTIGAELRMTIDWRKHELAIKAGGSDMQVPKSWDNGVGPSLIEAIRTFNENVEEAQLDPEWVVTYGSAYDVDEVNRKLGLVRSSTRDWERKPDHLSLGFGRLEEASLLVLLAT